MWKIIFLFLLPSVALAQTKDMKVIRVIDGDTIVVSAPFLPEPLYKHLYLRIINIDTPEKGGKAKCRSERNKSTEAKTFVEEQITSAKDIKVTLVKWDKYGGRVLGDLVIDNQSLSEKLISAGYAREYYGKKKRSWCRM